MLLWYNWAGSRNHKEYQIGILVEGIKFYIEYDMIVNNKTNKIRIDHVKNTSLLI